LFYRFNIFTSFWFIL